MGSADDCVRFFCELIESVELSLDIAVYVSNQTAAVTPKQVRSYYFRELPNRLGTIVHRDVSYGLHFRQDQWRATVFKRSLIAKSMPLPHS